MDHPDFETAFPDLVALATHVASRMVGDGAAAEDVAVECMTRAYERWDRVQAYAPQWVVRTSTNLCIDLLRKRSVPDHLLVAGPSVDVEGAVVARADVADLLGRLSVRQRRVVVLVVLGGYPAADAAEVLGVSTTTVRTHLRRALSTLRRHVAPDGGALPSTSTP